MAQAPFTTRKKEYPDTDYGDFLGVSREELLRELFTHLDTTMFDPATYSTLRDVSPEPLLDIESLPKRQAGFTDAFKSGLLPIYGITYSPFMLCTNRINIRNCYIYTF